MKEIFHTFSDIVQTIGTELGIVVAGQDILSSSDKDTKQFGTLVIATCQDLLSRFPWRLTIGDNPWVMSTDGNYKFKLELDTDTPLLDSRLIIEGTKWRYLNSKGYTYSEQFRFYEKRINDFAFLHHGNNVVDTRRNVPAPL